MSVNSVDHSLWRKTCAEKVETNSLTGSVSVDLAVIGGGYTGCSAALTAAKAGAEVCLLEAEEIGHGGSGRNVGLVNAGLWLPPKKIRERLGEQVGNRLIQLLAAAPAEVFKLIERHQIDCDPLQNGTLHCAHSKVGEMDLKSRYAQLKESGAPVELISAEDTKSKTGSDQFQAALFDPRAGTIQPLAYCVGLARAASQAGAQIFEQSAVLSLDYLDNHWVLATSNGTVHAKAVIQATNAYHQNLNLTRPQYVPMYFFQYATAPLAENLRACILSGGEGCWDTELIMTSFRMDRDGRFIIGGMGDLSSFGRSFHRGWVRRKLSALFPSLADQPLVDEWHGRIAMTSDHLPKIIKLGPNVLAVHGFSGRGIGPGTVFGRMMAESLLKDDLARLPIAPVAQYNESWTRTRRTFFETGAALTHLFKARS
nr:FAD-binding oxidoreductase [Ruegeria arenilitoris]